MPVQEDRVVRFGELSGADIEGKTSVEFKNIPTDFCQLNIHGVGRTLITNGNGSGGALVQDLYIDVHFQGIKSVGLSGVLTGDARQDQTDDFLDTRTYSQQTAGTHLLGIGSSWSPASFGQDYGGDQFVFRYYVMEPGSTRSKSVQYECNFQSTTNNNGYNTRNYGQHRIDTQAGATGSQYACSVFDNFTISLRGQYSPANDIVFGPGSRIWLEGWGGGHA